jgi:hypothetical protein
MTQLTDIVGGRIVCLFRSDIERISKIITDEFFIIESEDKILSDTDSFGYMSAHHVARLPDSFSGTRYNTIKGICFEIQIRTISMHAWAEISHYLAYKGEWDVPAHLKKSLNALSGLFYVADGEFERFYYESLKSRQMARELKNEEINLDTVSELLSQLYHNRATVPGNLVSDLVQQIKRSGYQRISEVREDLLRAFEWFEQFEKEHSKDGSFPTYSRVAAARVSLNMANKTFYQKRQPATRGRRANEPYERYWAHPNPKAKD